MAAHFWGRTGDSDEANARGLNVRPILYKNPFRVVELYKNPKIEENYTKIRD